MSSVRLGIVLSVGLAACAAAPPREPAFVSGAGHVNNPAPPEGAPIALDAIQLAARSAGRNEGSAWILDANGYVGTYLHLDAPGAVTVSVRAGGRSGGTCKPFMVLAVGDTRVGFEVGPEREYPETVNLAAGTHFFRADLSNGKPACASPLAIYKFSVWGATVLNQASDANALAAADTYIQSGRRGRARLRFDGAAPGTPVHLRLKRHAFHFGVNIPGTTNRFLVEGAKPDSEAGRFQRFVLEHFNTIVPSNAGKWEYNEGTRGFVTMDYIDLMLRWAARHGMAARMHTLLWDSPQQPVWVHELVARASEGDVAAQEDLTRAIERRIRYYVRDRAEMYQELDVINESLHHPRYTNLLGEAELRDVFNLVARAARDVGGVVRGYVNEFNVLQHSHELLRDSLPQGQTPGPTWSMDKVHDGVPDPYANWYRRHVDALRADGAEVGGIGVQYYADPKPGLKTPHSPGRIYTTLQNLTATGLPVTLTEFGVQNGGSATDAAAILEDTMRLVFGTPGANGFLMFGFWEGAIWDVAPAAVLVDKDWKLTEAGKRYEALMAAWGTEASAVVGPDGTLEMTGFYGDYAVEAAGKKLSFWLAKGQTEYALSIR
jgi:GH35 family endo-1,4-beta-xylanase